MKRHSLRLGASLAVLGLAHLTGCSTTQTGGTAATAFAPTPPGPGNGAVYIGRPFTFHTSILPLPVEVDGKHFASIGPDQYARVELPPGPHTIAVSNTYAGRLASGKPHPVEVKVEAGKTYYLLPIRWATNERYAVIMVNNMAIPQKTADSNSSFSVHPAAPGAPPPPEFSRLTAVQPAQ